MGTNVSHNRPTLWTTGTRASDRPDLCPRCRSTCGYMVRFKGPKVEHGYELVECGCKRGEHRDTLLRAARGHAGLDEAMADQTFDTFHPAEGTQQGYDEARRFAADPRGFLILAGRPGTGKTHLLAAIANALLSPADDRVEAVVQSDGVGRLLPVYCVTSRLVGRLTPGGSPAHSGADGRGEAGRYFDALLDAGCLLLDDLGAERDSAFAQERIFDLVDWRYANRRPTVIATNAQSSQLPDRLRSRLLDRRVSTTAVLKGEDYRLRSETKL